MPSPLSSLVVADNSRFRFGLGVLALPAFLDSSLAVPIPMGGMGDIRLIDPMEKGKVLGCPVGVASYRGCW